MTIRSTLASAGGMRELTKKRSAAALLTGFDHGVSQRLDQLGSGVRIFGLLQDALKQLRIPGTVILRAVCDGATVGADGRNFLAVLAHNRRLAFLPEIAVPSQAIAGERGRS